MEVITKVYNVPQTFTCALQNKMRFVEYLRVNKKKPAQNPPDPPQRPSNPGMDPRRAFITSKHNEEKFTTIKVIGVIQQSLENARVREPPNPH